MADYIRGNILAQSYVHFFDADYERLPLEEIQQDLQRRAEELASRIFERPVEISIAVEDGSVTLITTLLDVGGILYHNIAEFGSFGSGIVLIVKLAKKFGRHQNESAKAIVRPYTESRVYTEARPGLPGAFKKITNELVGLSNNKNNFRPNEIATRLKNLASKTNAILAKIPSSEEREKIAIALIEFVKEIFPARKPKKVPGKESLRPLLVARQQGVNNFIAKLKPKPKELSEEEQIQMIHKPPTQTIELTE